MSSTQWSVTCDGRQKSDAFSEVRMCDVFALAKELTRLSPNSLVRVYGYNSGVGHSVAYDANGNIVEGGW